MSRDRDFLLDTIELIETIDWHRPESEEAFAGGEESTTAVIHWM